MNTNYFQIIGWVGMLMILCGYFLMSFSIIDSQDLVYQVLNLMGSLGIVLVAWKHRDYQPMFLNIAWMLIAAVVIIKLIA